ncbi:hypothetical protein ACKWTF_016018 [Chironomus riparius]
MKKVTGSLPYGWEKKVEEDGRILFINAEKNVQSFTDPRLAFAQEEAGQSIRQKFDSSSTALSVLHGKDLTGKIALITGSNIGIGLETARSLAFHGCEIIFACRNRQTTMEAMEKLNEERRGNCKLNFIQLDLSSLRSTKNFCEEVKRQYQKIDFLILNAGIFGLPYGTTEDGLERHFQVNHLSHQFLTTQLSELLNHESRVVVLSSESHRFSNFPKHDLTKEILSPSASKFSSMMAYNNAKLCNVLFACELARKWQSRGISVFAVHPGNMISTGISRNWWFWRFLFVLVRPFTKSLQQGAATTVYCTTAPELTGLTGIYFNNCYICEPSKLSQNEDLAKELWNLSEKLIKEIFENYGDGAAGGTGMFIGN